MSTVSVSISREFCRMGLVNFDPCGGTTAARVIMELGVPGVPPDGSPTLAPQVMRAIGIMHNSQTVAHSDGVQPDHDGGNDGA